MLHKCHFCFLDYKSQLAVDKMYLALTNTVPKNVKGMDNHNLIVPNNKIHSI